MAMDRERAALQQRLAAVEAQLAACAAQRTALERERDVERQRAAEAEQWAQTAGQERDAAHQREETTAGILRLLSAAPADQQPVLDAIVAAAARLLGVRQANLFLLVDGALQRQADAYPSARALPRGTRLALTDAAISGRAVRSCHTVHVFGTENDVQAAFPGVYVEPGVGPLQAHMATPLLRNGAAIGALQVSGPRSRPFSEREIALLETFADQAVVAVENARLFAELDTRNRALVEGLERETATSAVLATISRAATNLNEVLDTIVASTGRLPEADQVLLFLYEEAEGVHLAAYNPPAQWYRGLRVPRDPELLGNQVLVTGHPLQVSG